ncbi:MAG: hypothetical protein ACRC7G_03270 [Beijerinckiaceae bacterium]
MSPASRPFTPLLPLALLALGWLVLAWPWLSGEVTVPWDSKAHFQPQLAFLARSLGDGQSPFWNPYVFAGHPQVADPQALIFAPPFLLLALFNPSPDLMAMDAVVYATLLVGAAFILLFFRDRNWAAAGALVAALSFAFGGAAAWRIQHVGQVMSIAYFPIALVLLDRALKRGSFLYGLSAGVVAGLMLLGRDQVAFLGLLVLAAYVLHRIVAGRGQLKRILMPLAGGALGGFVTVAVPMVMTLLLAADSNRPMISLAEAGKGSLHPWSLLTGLIPHLFGIARPLADYWGPPSPDWGWVDLYLARNMATFYFGMLPLLGLALFPFVWRFRPRFAMSPESHAAGEDAHRRDALFLFVGFVVLMLYSIGRYSPVFAVFFTLVPGIDKFRRPADALFVACALGSMAGGYALNRYAAATRYHLPRWAAFAGLGFALACFIAGGLLATSVGRLPQTVVPIVSAACFVAAGALMLLVLRRMDARTPAALAMVGLFMIADLGWNNAPNESTGLTPDTYDVLRPKSDNETITFLKKQLAGETAPDRLDRVELVGLGFHWPNASMVHGLHHTLGYNPLRSAIYSGSVGARDHIAGPDQRLFTPLLPNYRSILTDMAGLRYIASAIPTQDIYNAAPRKDLPAKDMPPPVFDPRDFPLLGRTADAYIYENPRALPRVLFAGRAVQADFDALMKSGDWPSFDPRETVLVDRQVLPAEAESAVGERKVRIVSYRNTEVVIAGESPSGGFIVLNDSWNDWWRVEVNGKPAELERANVAFRAVRVPAGNVTVRFTFQPLRGALAQLLRRR